LTSFNSNIKIGNNFIRFHNKSLKLSNISRTWIFRFDNIEKKKFIKAKEEYEKSRDEKIKRLYAATIFLIFVAIMLFYNMGFPGIVPLAAAGICGYMVYRIKNNDITYSPSAFPDKFGLGIEMNSGYTEIFTAIGKDGEIALQELQKDIDEADKRQDIVVFNMNDNSITVENNDGIISTGDYADNIFEGRNSKQYE